MNDKKSNAHYAGQGGMKLQGSTGRRAFNRYVNFCSHDAGPRHPLWRFYKRFVMRDDVECRCCKDVGIFLWGIVVGIITTSALWVING